MKKIFFICGTDTDVGKSIITAGLARCLPDARAVKVVQTGQRFTDQNIYRAARPEAGYHTMLHFALPASPHLAARQQGRTINLSALAEDIMRLARPGQYTLLEGSGGIMTPLNGHETFLDLLKLLDVPVILVVNDKLGAISQALTALNAINSAGLVLAGLVFNHAVAGSAGVELNNIAYFKDKIDCCVEVPFIRHLPVEAAWLAMDVALKDFAHAISKPLPAAQCGQIDKNNLWHPYAAINQPAHTVRRAQGNYLYLSDGRKVIDGMSSWWCAIHGYGHPKLVAAMQSQAGKMPHVMFGGLTHQPAMELGQKLLALLPARLNKIFFADSGSVAVEVALKIARQYWLAKGEARKNRFISLAGACHGDTFGAMSVCDPVNGMHHMFSGMLAQNFFASRPATPFHGQCAEDDIAELHGLVEQNHRQCAGLIMEPIVQGAGGMWFYHPEYLRAVRRLCDEYGLLLIFDEIATGFGRTGKMFASQWAGVSPDIMCLGKALTGGMLSLAAAITTEQIAAQAGVLMHGPTFMANPLACRVATANIDLLESWEWAEQVRNIESRLTIGLASCKNHLQVQDVRVLGAIGVVEMRQPVNQQKLQKYLLDEHKVWLRPFNRLIYTMPPYTITDEELLSLTNAVCRAVEGKHWA